MSASKHSIKKFAETDWVFWVCSHDVGSHYQKHEMIKRFMELKLIDL